MRITSLFFLLTSLLSIGGCSREYSVGKILVVDETQSSPAIDIQTTAERLLKGLKNIKADDPSRSNATLRITLNETNIHKEKGRGKNRYHISLLLTATLKDGSIQIFQSESTSSSEIDKVDPHSQINGLLSDALLKLDYQCTIRKKKEGDLFSIFYDKKTAVWQCETVLEEIANRISSDDIRDRQAVWKFLLQAFTSRKKECGEKIIGIMSSMDISKFYLSENQKDLLSKELIRYCIGKETYIQIHVITILSKLNNDIAKSFIFTLSTGSTNKTVQNHAKEALNEIERRNISPTHTITSK